MDRRSFFRRAAQAVLAGAAALYAPSVLRVEEPQRYRVRIQIANRPEDPQTRAFLSKCEEYMSARMGRGDLEALQGWDALDIQVDPDEAEGLMDVLMSLDGRA